MLQACSALTIGYNRAGTLLYWWLDEQWDLTETQSLRVRADLDALHTWHRRDALPSYATLLAQWATQSAQDVTADQVCQQWEVARSTLQATATQAAPALIGLAQSLKPSQLAHWRAQQDKANRSFRDDFVTSPQSGLEKRTERMIDRLEMFYGPLSPTQRQQVKTLLARGSFDGQTALAERLRRQNDLVQTIAIIQQQPQQTTSAFNAWVQRLMVSPSATYRSAAQQWQTETCELVATVHNLSTASQRQTVRERLLSYQNNITVLAQQE